MRPAGVVLGDDLGPRGRRLATIASVVSVIVLAALVVVALRRLANKGQFAGRKWEFLTNAGVRGFLLGGLGATLKAAIAGMVLALLVGGILALGRIAPQRIFRWVSGLLVQFFRAVPLLTLILFVSLSFPSWGLHLSALWYLVIALVAYNSAVLAEVFRAGILSLPKGQREAAYSLGMSWWQAMLLVVLPQAVRRMIPAIVSQLVTLLKDTSLGLVIPYEELLRRGQITGESFKLHNPLLQSLFVVAFLYWGVNFTLSRIARRLEVRQRRRFGGAPPTAAVEDLAALGAHSAAVEATAREGLQRPTTTAVTVKRSTL
jgi:glutamate transport system permease protein